MFTLLGWLAVVVLITANAVFVAAEFGLTSVGRARVGRDAAAGDRRAGAVQRMLSRAGVNIEPNLEINDTATLLDLIEAGLGVAILAEALVTQRRQLSAIPIRPAAHWTISAITTSPAPTNPAARQLWTQLTADQDRPTKPVAVRGRRQPGRRGGAPEFE